MRLSVTAFLFGLFLFSSPPSDACCPAGPRGSEVRIADQEILVVWDEKKKREHFIRQAKFKSDQSEFGFLVPTPTKPELEEADADVFDRLRVRSKPKIKTDYHFHFGSIFASSKKRKTDSKKMDSKKPSVEVLERKNVAGFDAAVLRADDANALKNWLTENGFDHRDELIDWVQPYIEQKWIVTAFKFTGLGSSWDIKPTRALRMSFDTERPLFPYRVPEDNQIDESQPGHLLRVHFVGPKRVLGALGEEKTPWSAKLIYARKENDISSLLSGTGPAAEVEGQWLTSFDDNSWPGSDEDLYFSEAPTQEEFEIVKVVRADIHIYYEFIVGFLGLAAFLFVQGKGKKSKLKADQKS